MASKQVKVIQLPTTGMVTIPDGYAVVRPTRAQKEHIKQRYPDTPLSKVILLTRVQGNPSSIQGDPELLKPRSRSLSTYKSDKSDTSRKTALSVMKTIRKSKGKKRPSDKGETKKSKQIKAKARKKQSKKKLRKNKQGKTKQRKTKRRSSKKI